MAFCSCPGGMSCSHASTCHRTPIVQNIQLQEINGTSHSFKFMCFHCLENLLAKIKNPHPQVRRH